MGITQRLGTIPLAIQTDASNNVGIGAAPSGSYKLEVTGTAKVSSTLLVSGALTVSYANARASINSTTATNSAYMSFGNTVTGYVGLDNSTGSDFGNGAYSLNLINGGAYNLNLGTSNTTRLTITSAGNVGIAVTPNTWASSFKALQVGTASLSQNNNTTAYIGSNWVSESGGDKYITTNAAAIYAQNTGAHIWYTAPSGTAGAAMTFTESMRITSGGNVGIGNTGNSTYKLLVTGNTTDGTTFSFYAFNSANVDLFGIRTDGAIYTGAAGNSPYNLTTPSAANCFINTNGYLYRSTSSLKYKKNVQNYTKGLAEVLQLRPVSYESINEEESGNIYAGLIAEEVNDLGLTEFVQYRTDGTPDALAYANMVALLVKAIQELSKQNEELSNRLNKAGL